MRKTLTVRSEAAPADAEARARDWAPSAERAERLRERAREERRHMTEAEKALWERLSGSRVGGLKFVRKAVVGSAIVDFACPSRWLAIALTPPDLSAEVAALQDRKLTEAGIRVLRFAEAEVLTDLDRVVKAVAQLVNEPFERPGSRRAARPPERRGPRTTGPRR